MHIGIPRELLKLQMTGPYPQRFQLAMSEAEPRDVLLNFPGNSDTQLGFRTTDRKEQEIDDFWF